MLKRVRIATLALAFAMMWAAVGCFAPKAAHSTNPPVPAPSDTTLPGRWTADFIAQAFTAINQKVGANPADYLQVNLNGYDLEVQAINPQKRQNVDQFAYDGTNVKTTPVDVSHNQPGAVEAAAFKSDTVKPDVLAKAMASAVNDSGIEDAKVEGLFIKKWEANEPEPHLSVFVKSPRASKSVYYDLNTGQFQKVSS
jgi:hypothetical protein